jgi:uncharacterized LabA/DUF88 family protein
MIKHRQQRVGVLVDVANLYHSAKNLYNSRVEFKEALKYAVGGRNLIRAIAYVIKTETEEETQFFEALLQQGFEIQTKDLQIFAGGAKKADWDVGITVDAIKLADKLDSIILMTGDGDFIPLASYLQSKGCLVEVVAFHQTTSSRLIEVANDFLDLSGNKKFLRK